MDNQERVYRILDEYLKGSLPHDVDRKVMSWLTDGVRADDKEEALRKLWNDRIAGDKTPDQKTVDAFRKVCLMLGMGLPKEEAGRQDRYRPVPVRRRSRVRLFLNVAAVVIPVMALIGGALLVWNQGRVERAPVVVSASPVGQKKVTLPDGSVVYLNSSSSLTYAEDFGHGLRREVRLEGEAFFKVDRSAGKPFVVRAGEVDVRVLGTEFNVMAHQGRDAQVELRTGKVGVSSEGGSCLLEGDINKAVYSLSEGTYRLEKIEPGSIAAWHIENLAFDDTPLDEALHRVGRFYDMQVVFPLQGSIDGQRITTWFAEDDSIEYVMSIISGISNGFGYRIDKTGGRLIIEPDR